MAEPDEKQRTFLGVGLDRPTRDLLAAHLDEHLPGRMPGRSVPPANWHITVRFLGWTRRDQVDRVVYEVSERISLRPFSLRFGGLGAFPRPRRASVLWLGLASGAEQLEGLARACEDAAVAVGFTPEDRPFHPHLTLARIRPPSNVETLVDGFPPFDVRLEVAEVTLFRSHLGRGGARYEALEHIAL